MLDHKHLVWNVPQREIDAVNEYFSQIAAFASHQGFFPNDAKFEGLRCDGCAMPIPRSHSMFLDGGLTLRYCFECIETDYQRQGNVGASTEGMHLVYDPLPRPEAMNQFEDKGEN